MVAVVVAIVSLMIIAFLKLYPLKEKGVLQEAELAVPLMEKGDLKEAELAVPLMEKGDPKEAELAVPLKEKEDPKEAELAVPLDTSEKKEIDAAIIAPSSEPDRFDLVGLRLLKEADFLLIAIPFLLCNCVIMTVYE